VVTNTKSSPSIDDVAAPISDDVAHPLPGLVGHGLAGNAQQLQGRPVIVIVSTEASILKPSGNIMALVKKVPAF